MRPLHAPSNPLSSLSDQHFLSEGSEALPLPVLSSLLKSRLLSSPHAVLLTLFCRKCLINSSVPVSNPSFSCNQTPVTGLADPQSVLDSFRVEVGPEIRQYNSDLWKRSYPSNTLSRRTSRPMPGYHSSPSAANDVEHPQPSYRFPYQSMRDAGSRCRVNQFHCVWENRCISRNKECDGHNDCVKGEDEANCERAKPTAHTRVQPVVDAVVLPTPAALRSSPASHTVSQPKQMENDILTDMQVDPVPSSGQEVEDDGPKVNPVYDRNFRPLKQKTTTTTTITTPAPTTTKAKTTAKPLVSNDEWDKINKRFQALDTRRHVPVHKPVISKPATASKPSVKEALVTPADRQMRCSCTCTPSFF